MDYQWHYDYARLAWDAGFKFGNYNPNNLDKSKLNSFDIDRVIKERDINTVEQYIPLVVHYILEDDQAEILDNNFVKIFKISQLAIEYLLFCKKYLDNTVVLLKKEMARLKQQLNNATMHNEENDAQSSLNPRREILTAVYRCEKCDKAFSTENYLNSHIKRRHNDGNVIQIDDDKIQSEIKELKERLNSTDKLLYQIDVSKPSVEKNSIDENLLADIEKKFASFRKQVENEIATLHLEKNIYEEKYTKLFDLILQSKEKQSVLCENIGTMTDNYNISITNEFTEAYSKVTADDCTQTEDPKLNALQSEIVQVPIDYCEIVEPPVVEEDSDKKIEEKLNILSEDIENKISTSMDVIKNQMHTFWEEMKKENLKKNEDIQQVLVTSEDLNQAVKPQVKPRTRIRTPIVRPRLSKETIKHPVELKKESKQIPFVNELIQVFGDRDSDNASDISEFKSTKDIHYESSSEKDSLQISNMSQTEVVVPAQTNINNPEKRLKSKSQDNAIKKINKIIHGRLNGTSFSVDISEPKFNRAMDILAHHTNLNKKILKKTSGNKPKKNDNKNHHLGSSTKVVKICLKKTRPNNNTKSEPPEMRTLAIKNRSLFETDTDTEDNLLQKK